MVFFFTVFDCFGQYGPLWTIFDNFFFLLIMTTFYHFWPLFTIFDRFVLFWPVLTFLCPYHTRTKGPSVTRIRDFFIMRSKGRHHGRYKLSRFLHPGLLWCFFLDILRMPKRAKTKKQMKSRIIFSKNLKSFSKDSKNTGEGRGWGQGHLNFFKQKEIFPMLASLN